MLESVTCGDTQITAADLRMKIAKYEKVDPSTGQTTFQSQFDVSWMYVRISETHLMTWRATFLRVPKLGSQSQLDHSMVSNIVFLDNGKLIASQVDSLLVWRGSVL